MKRKLQIISTAAASVLAFSALAQDTPKTDRSDYTRDHLPYARRVSRLNDAAKASDVIGMTIKNYQDEKLGKVEDLAIDVESGRVVQVIVSSGGIAGVGNTLTAVPPGALHRDVAQKVLHLDSTKEKLKASPKFEMSNWKECCDSNHLAEVYRYYGEEPAFKFIHRGDTIQDGVRSSGRTSDPVPNRDADGTPDNRRMTRDRQSMIPAARLAYIQKASKLIGTSVKNSQDEKLGRVENILVDLPAGRVVAVIISSGGFLGLGDELSAVPPTALTFTSNRDALQLNASKESLGNAPHFKANQWPDFEQPTYAYGVYQAYRVEPYFTTNSSADNTARNVRDRNDRTLTPLDQGNSKSDIDITAQIRKEIVAGKNLSVNAHNVKVITTQGHVTLRGPVDTAEEKRLIDEIARRMARSDKVDNQLEVKGATGSNN